MTFNNLKVEKIELFDSNEGEITFTNQNGKQIEAFFWGEKFEIEKRYLVEFSSLDYPLDWSVIFSENKQNLKSLIPENRLCSYLAYGQIKSINPTIVDFGDIVMEINLPTNDEKVIGEYIYWKIDRLDILNIKSCT
ncbi:hypothetical protein [Flavobacterium urocaniciphilum]|uniref:Uncharacterized protein n=1 Tax=Flavobacterium urocaniciphilum TaxID=1299341 RepID=A0A1H9D6L6_9FLAO|nr:hypothetical protein [Flavobacterium urocaniciphilum]SEQ08438.1 hypothetical protein SAMN05444005_10631 [Flavobacterium urocaniciphilum]